jgi:hypothetical protein
MKYLLALAVLTATLGHAIPASALDTDPPLTDAGLDQTVELGATVYLDGGGTTDPDGSVTDYAWHVERPDGTTTTPNCSDCVQTQFTPNQTGTYTVTLTATDDDGNSRNDTLYVTVTPGDPPTVTLDTPTTVTAGTPATASASVTAGSAPVSTLRWRIDGTTIQRNVTARSLVRTRSLPTTTPGTVDVSLVVVDAAGQTTTATTTVTVVPAPPAGGNGTTPPGGGGPSPNGTNGTAPGSGAPTASIHLTGPQLVLGDYPLDATYRLDHTPANLTSVDWYVDGTYARRTETFHANWTAGTHSLHARLHYRNGTTQVATFPGANDTVVADPAPRLTLSLSPNTTTIRGRATATDAFRNLDTISVTRNGTTITSTVLDRDSSLLQPKTRQTTFVTPATQATPYRFTVTATDDRGQTTTITRTITTNQTTNTTTRTDPGNVTILSAGFVNDPVDSYHPKLDDDRYAAHHVTRLKLNGTDPETVNISTVPMGEKIRPLETMHYRTYDQDTGLLTIHSYFAGTSPGTYEIRLKIRIGPDTTSKKFFSKFDVHSSPPEIRMSVENTGTEYRTGKWGMVVDASESFDPDGTDLDYLWSHGAEGLNTNDSVGKFDSRSRAELTVRDDSEASTTVSGEFLQYFNPGFRQVEVVDGNRLSESGSVLVKIKTPIYAFTKRTYNAKLAVEVVGEGTVVEWSRHKRSLEQGDKGEAQEAHDNLKTYYVGYVRVDTSALEDGEAPTVRIYNEAHPQMTAQSRTISLDTGGNYEYVRTNVSVVSVTYEVNRTRTETEVVTSTARRETLKEEGYVVAETEEVATVYELERQYERTSTETSMRTFATRSERSRFIATSSKSWNRDGTETVIVTSETTEKVWRDEKTGSGTFTGRTRTVIPPWADTTTERQFEYKTTETVTVTEEVEMYIPGQGTKKVTVTRNETVTETNTYWAESPRAPQHPTTGNIRTVPETGSRVTQYQFEVDRTVRKSVTRYVATRSYEKTTVGWRTSGTIEVTPSNTDWIQKRDRIQVADTRFETTWSMQRNRTGIRTQGEYDDASNVKKTVVVVEGELHRKQVAGDGDSSTLRYQRDFETTITIDGAKSDQAIKRMIRARLTDTGCESSDPIASGCEGYKDDN